MADLEICLRIEHKLVIKILVAEQCKLSKIFRRMFTVYEEAYFTQKGVYKRANLFKERRKDSPVKKKFKSQRSNRKVMLKVCWNVQGPITVSCPEKESTVNSTNYCEFL